MRSVEFEFVLVEDNPDDAQLTLRALQGACAGGRVHHAEDGAKALEYLFDPARAEARAARFVLLDLKLPKIDGLEVLRRLKSDPRTQPIPVVILTSSREERDIAESYRLGANSYVVKPGNFEEYLAAVSALGRYWSEVNTLLPPAGG